MIYLALCLSFNFFSLVQAFLELGELLILSDTGAALDAFKTVWGYKLITCCCLCGLQTMKHGHGTRTWTMFEI